MNCTNWEVGSTWYTSKDPITTIGSRLPIRQILDLKSKHTLLSTCRSAIKAIISDASISGKVLVPSFTCHSVVDPFIECGIEVWPYTLHTDLSVDWDNLIAMANDLKPSAILLHGYFGFDTLSDGEKAIEVLRAKHIVIIEDLTQNMFSNTDRIPSDYKIGSVRKWFPIPDGAFIEGLEIGNLREDIQLAEAKLNALETKSQYIFEGNIEKNVFVKLHSAAEKLLDSRTNPHAISSYSVKYLQSVPIEKYNTRRIENYTTLSSRLSKHPEIIQIRTNLKPGEIPFHLPVYITKNRAGFQKFMAEHNIYPTIIWSCPDVLAEKIDPNSRHIYDNILCFHCDQRYDTDDMNKVGEIVELYFKTKNHD